VAQGIKQAVTLALAMVRSTVVERTFPQVVAKSRSLFLEMRATTVVSVIDGCPRECVLSDTSFAAWYSVNELAANREAERFNWRRRLSSFFTP
jgi:uncharacterized metal-binding protein